MTHGNVRRPLFCRTGNAGPLASRTSVGGAATGEGGDRVVVDDPHKADEAQSDVTRDSVLEWWDGTLSTRLNQPRSGAMVIVMQRLHERP